MNASSLAPSSALRRHSTKQQFVYETMREAIIKCEIPPGERLVIDDLARRLLVSIIPVREALRLLESEGLVLNVAHVGATVAPVSRESILEVFTVLEGLESVSTRAAAQRAQPDDFRELDALLAQMDDALTNSRLEGWAELNTKLHLTIARMAAMPMLERMLRRALDHWDRVRRHFFSDVTIHRADLAQRQHHDIIAQMKAQDLTALERSIRQHNQGALTSYTAYLESAGSGEIPRT
jgi:DNA-binding GntR family transcriptional regulator